MHDWRCVKAVVCPVTQRIRKITKSRSVQRRIVGTSTLNQIQNCYSSLFKRDYQMILPVSFHFCHWFLMEKTVCLPVMSHHLVLPVLVPIALVSRLAFRNSSAQSRVETPGRKVETSTNIKTVGASLLFYHIPSFDPYVWPLKCLKCLKHIFRFPHVFCKKTASTGHWLLHPAIRGVVAL